MICRYGTRKPGRSEFETVFKVRQAFKFQISHFSKVGKPFKYQAYFTLYMIWYHVYNI